MIISAQFQLFLKSYYEVLQKIKATLFEHGFILSRIYASCRDLRETTMDDKLMYTLNHDEHNYYFDRFYVRK